MHNPSRLFTLCLVFCSTLPACSTYSSITPKNQIPTQATEIIVTPPLISCPDEVIATASTTTPELLPQNATPIPVGYWAQREQTSYSPDGKLKISINIFNSVVVESVATGERINLSGDVSLRPYFSLQSWFPDSKGFIIFDADLSGEKSPYDRLIIFRVDEANQKLNSFIFEPIKKRNQAFRQRVAISPDSKNVAVIVDMQTIYIINQKAEPIQTIYPLDKQGHLDEVTWTNYGLVYVARGIQSDPQHTEMRLIDPKKASNGSILLRNDASLQIIHSIDPFSPRIMFFHYSSAIDSAASGELAIFNLETKQIEQSLIVVHGYALSGFRSVEANNPHLVALKYCDEGKNFYVFNWITGKLINKDKHVNSILEWRQDLQSFILLQGEYPNTWLEAVAP